jgi:hypothetical protein
LLVIHSDFGSEGSAAHSTTDGARWRWDRYRQAHLTVRTRPDLPLEVQAQGGSLRIVDMAGPIKGHIRSGALALERVHGPLDVLVQDGSLSVSGVIRSGTSRLRCEVGTMRIALDPASDVRVTAHTSMGHLSLPGKETAKQKMLVGNGHGQVTIGRGTALLELEGAMGSIQVMCRQVTPPTS